jgi:glycosyltransferase involved in cell wall biosynthesis
MGYRTRVSPEGTDGGVDIFLMPSQFEPCGLGQMIAMRYGSVPVVRATGGLADTVIDWDTGNGTRKGTGFTFNDYTGDAFWGALERALDTFRDKKAWRGLQERGMKADPGNGGTTCVPFPPRVRCFSRSTRSPRVVMRRPLQGPVAMRADTEAP